MFKADMYKLHLLKPNTGQVLNSDGEPYQRGQELHYKTTFSNLDDALKEKNSLLVTVEWGLVQIYDPNTQKNEFYSNEELSNQYISEVTKLGLYRALPWYKKVFVNKPELKYVKT